MTVLIKQCFCIHDYKLTDTKQVGFQLFKTYECKKCGRSKSIEI
nr:MAG TPA: hypothetical protein [Caudoviricetes sp.]